MITIRRAGLTTAERFWSKVTTDEITGCRIWTAALLKTGYGAFRVNGETVRAHRVAWELTHGPIANGLCVLHRCDNRRCCNPEHLFLGTYADNYADMAEKGRQSRHSRPRGTQHGNAKLNPEAVRAIRVSYAANSRYGALMALARKYGVSLKTIDNVVKRTVWTHVG